MRNDNLVPKLNPDIFPESWPISTPASRHIELAPALISMAIWRILLTVLSASEEVEERAIARRGSLALSCIPKPIPCMAKLEPNDKVINHFQIRNVSGALMSKSIHYITVELPKLQREIPEDVQDNERVLYLIDRQGGLKEIPRQLQGHGLDNIVNMSIFASMSENNQKEYVSYMMDELDSMSKIRTAKNDGKAEGKAEGIAEGASAKSIEIAKAMLSKGIDVHTVAECTGLPVEQIVKLK